MTFYTDTFPPNHIMLALGKRARGGFMHRCSSGFLLTLVITLVVALTGCLGKSSINPAGGGVKTVTLSPGSTSPTHLGGPQLFTATGPAAPDPPTSPPSPHLSLL